MASEVVRPAPDDAVSEAPLHVATRNTQFQETFEPTNPLSSAPSATESNETLGSGQRPSAGPLSLPDRPPSTGPSSPPGAPPSAGHASPPDRPPSTRPSSRPEEPPPAITLSPPVERTPQQTDGGSPGPNLPDDNRPPIVSPTQSHTKNNGVEVDQKWKQYLFYSVTFFFSVIWITLTIFYAFLSSSSKRLTIFSDPGKTIFALSFAGTASVFLLNKCVFGACDILRWSLSAREGGVGAATFLSLNPTTGIWDVFWLMASGQKVGNRRWGAQRYLVLK